MTKATKQIATLATLKLLGLATIKEIASDYIVFQAHRLATVNAAMKIAEEMTDAYGIQVTIRF